MRVKRLPTILALHLKRFKYVEQYNRHIKVITSRPKTLVYPLPHVTGFPSSRVPPGAPFIQHLGRRREPGQDVRPCGCGHPLRLRPQQVNYPDIHDQLVTFLSVFRGHYISIVKSHGFWLIFDDDIVDKIDPATIEDFYGLTADVQKSSETGYILFYESRDPQ